MTRTATLLAALTLAACQQEAPPQPAEPQDQVQPPAATVPPPVQPAPADPAQPTPEPQASDDWRDYAKPEDAERLKQLDAAWERALAGARKAGHEDELEKLAGLADPKTRALANPHPAPGDYRCRTIKIGGLSGLIAYPWFRCRVALTPGGDLTYVKLTGSQRGEGKFYPSGESDRRLVYMGGQAWGLDQTRATPYGEDPMRDQIGVLERIGDQRWRLLLPLPRVESELDIIELAK